MILVDTSVWIDHLRVADEHLVLLLNGGQVLAHPMVIGELACGNLPERDEVLGLLAKLPGAPIATDAEALLFIERHRLMGSCVGYVDVHLLAAASLAGSALLWTRDRRLLSVASGLGWAYDAPAVDRR